MNMKQKVGKFYASYVFIDDFPTAVKMIMGKCIVVRAENLLATEKIEYTAISDYFRELEEGEKIPEYEWFISNDGDIWCEEIKP